MSVWFVWSRLSGNNTCKSDPQLSPFLLTVRRSCVSCCQRSPRACPGSATRRGAAPWCRAWTRVWCLHLGPPDPSETPGIRVIRALHYTIIMANHRPSIYWPGGGLCPPTTRPAPPQGWGQGWAPDSASTWGCSPALAPPTRCCSQPRTGYSTVHKNTRKRWEIDSGKICRGITV